MFIVWTPVLFQFLHILKQSENPFTYSLSDHNSFQDYSLTYLIIQHLRCGSITPIYLYLYKGLQSFCHKPQSLKIVVIGNMIIFS